MSKLLDTSIEDVIVRVELYRQLLAYLADSTNEVLLHEVVEDEQYAPYLLSNRVYDTQDLGWVVMQVAGLTDEFEPLPVSYSLRLPPLPVVRSLIREVKDTYT